MFTKQLKELIDIHCAGQQKILSNEVDIPASTINCWFKRGTKPTYIQIIKLADYFEVSTDYLLGRTNDIGMVQVHTELTDNESKLLAYYNSLDEDGQSTLLDIARIAAGAGDQYKAVKPQKIS